MATIKLQPSGAVVLKDGKVSCGCCDTECCLYPAPSSGITLPYPVADLPDSVLIDGVSFPKNDPPLLRQINDPPVFVDVYYGDPLVLSVWVALQEEFGVTFWHSYAGGSFNFNHCLIEMFGYTSARDEFPDTLTVNGTDSIHRDPITNLCTWSGGSWTLRYNSTIYKFQLNGTAKTGNQNEPTGTYGANSVT
jgi:hypothetical protein